jgi:hypothetical protein
VERQQRPQFKRLGLDTGSHLDAADGDPRPAEELDAWFTGRVCALDGEGGRDGPRDHRRRLSVDLCLPVPSDAGSRAVHDDDARRSACRPCSVGRRPRPRRLTGGEHHDHLARGGLAVVRLLGGAPGRGQARGLHLGFEGGGVGDHACGVPVGDHFRRTGQHDNLDVSADRVQQPPRRCRVDGVALTGRGPVGFDCDAGSGLGRLRRRGPPQSRSHRDARSGRSGHDEQEQRPGQARAAALAGALGRAAGEGDIGAARRGRGRGGPPLRELRQLGRPARRELDVEHRRAVRLDRRRLGPLLAVAEAPKVPGAIVMRAASTSPGTSK